ncbi:MAG TPA: hypothetical protein VGZ22_01225 [Isosphaeraceae bacterium]|jgi:hypothetical protein|nr:hypothetical protein [Isosphaeraceae bacterium]
MRLRRYLLVWLLLLAPWGGPCERGARAADPLTAPGVPTSRELDCLLHSGSQFPDGGSELPSTHIDVLIDDEDGEESEGQCILGPTLEIDLTFRRSICPLDTAPQIAPESLSTRSPILRC